MIDIILSLISVYFFILIGFIAKKHLKEKIDEKTLIFLSIFYLQPILTFWGLTKSPINFNLISSPIIYLLIITVALLFTIMMSKIVFKNEKEQSISIVAPLIGNTGNLGIPLGIAIFGQESVAYTTIINIANIFFTYTVGVYFYSKSSFSIKESLKNIIKIPVIWFAIVALIYSYLEIQTSPHIIQMLNIGAYSSIAIQLIIFGIYLSNSKFKLDELKLNSAITFNKFILLPIIGYFILQLFNIPTDIKLIIMLELIVPLAVTNLNLSALYDCKSQSVATAIFISSVLFLGLIFLDLYLMKILI
ncbi:MAG: AEC family transporter [Campylobacterales bacterium]|nr:AEC family transporter [Campylobacterales bacterium]